MTEERSVVDQALDLLVYAPLGLALEAKDLIPKLADRGRGQVALARLAGRFAAAESQQRAQRFVDEVVGSTDGAEPTGGGADLPIDDYDTCTAKQVLARLDGLDADELALVLEYERAHRSRATVINRIQQLQRRS